MHRNRVSISATILLLAVALSAVAQNTVTGAGALPNNSGEYNTADGSYALASNTQGSGNTALGASALGGNLAGNYSTAVGEGALLWGPGSYNTAIGYIAGNPTACVSGEGCGTPDGGTWIGEYNTFLGYLAGVYGPAVGVGTGTLTPLYNATAIGAYAQVQASNSMVLGSINGVNGATADTMVGVGITTPTYKLHVGSINNGFRVEGPTPGTLNPVAVSVGGNGDFGIDAEGVVEGRFVVKDTTGYVGIGTSDPTALLSVNGTANKPGGGSWGVYSDRRLKTLDGAFNSGLSRILKINPVRYRYKQDNAMGIRDTDEHVGLVAQEVQKVIPEAVTENSKGYLLVNNDPIIWAMLNAIKEQQSQALKKDATIRDLQAQIKAEQSAAKVQQAQIAQLTSQVKMVQAALASSGQSVMATRTLSAQVASVR